MTIVEISDDVTHQNPGKAPKRRTRVENAKTSIKVDMMRILVRKTKSQRDAKIVERETRIIQTMIESERIAKSGMIPIQMAKSVEETILKMIKSLERKKIAAKK